MEGGMLQKRVPRRWHFHSNSTSGHEFSLLLLGPAKSLFIKIQFYTFREGPWCQNLCQGLETQGRRSKANTFRPPTRSSREPGERGGENGVSIWENSLPPMTGDGCAPRAEGPSSWVLRGPHRQRDKLAKVESGAWDVQSSGHLLPSAVIPSLWAPVSLSRELPNPCLTQRTSMSSQASGDVLSDMRNDKLSLRRVRIGLTLDYQALSSSFPYMPYEAF
ncbi:hypothetical protein TREES_T100011487 [Tupaia chinensis]|uniref:Uncharacterized protein n=1 Tax=Tupaia chinensis TaxID=246437 RepID=L9L848_TUPCH|nr:hypothetical protein TREES_T100011487 [Tupaia chinensis]